MYVIKYCTPDPAAGGNLRYTQAEFDSGIQPAMRRGLPLLKPPYSRMIAIDINAGEHAWMQRHRNAGMEYDCRMKLKTSITLDRDVVAAVEAIARNGESRSQVIERLLRQSLAARTRAAMDERDIGIINAHADALNEEALDVLGYQVET